MIFWFVLLYVTSVDSLPDGAPKSACYSLLPVHRGIEAQTTNAPYEIHAELSDHKIIVRVSSPVGEKFEGFVLQARSFKDPSKFIDGKFTTSQISKVIDCFDSTENTLTHVNRTPKAEIMTEWTPKGVLKKEVIFRATIASQFDIFWTEIDSNAVMDNSSFPIIEDLSLYEKCFDDEGCVGLPDGCAEERSCEVLLKYSNSPSGIHFSLQGVIEPSHYMAMGISEDSMMGNDYVTECIRDGTNVVVRESWNEGKSNTRTKELSRSDYTASFIDELTSCSWRSPLVNEFNGQTYNFAEKTFYVLIAKGEVTEGTLKVHDKKMASMEALNLTKFGSAEAPDSKTDYDSHHTEDQHPPVTPQHESFSTSGEEISSHTNDLTTASSCSSYSGSTCLVFLLTGLFFARRHHKIYF